MLRHTLRCSSLRARSLADALALLSTVASPPPAAAAPPALPPRVTLETLAQRKVSRVAITVVTAYDQPTAAAADAAGVDVLLVGDSVGMVVLGLPSTVSVTLDAMVHHAAAVSRGAPRRPLLVGDLPFGTYATDRKSVV